MNPSDGESTRDPVSGIVMLGDVLPYLDGAEQSLRDAIEQCTDTSSWSDELWREASTWAERYHLSPQRGAIIAPLALGPGDRVLEVGAGTGAVTRAIGETGASVTAVEGNIERARIVAARCADLSNVNVLCGQVTAFDEPGSFDVVIGVGLLEYSSTRSGGNTGPELLLSHLARQLTESGLFALAIENQLGLKYLIGYAEDHLGLPWIGVDGYQLVDGPRTWSKAALGQMFADAGLTTQHWAFPFPDYKFPRVILDESAYREPDAPDLVDGLCRWPATDSEQEPHLLCDSRAAHRVMLEAGLGPSVSNSFLIFAGRNDAAIDQHVRPAIAWMTGGQRRSTWKRWRELKRAENGGRQVATIKKNHESKQLGWLRQSEAPEAGWTNGRNLEAVLLAAIASGSEEAITATLSGWMEQLETRAVDVETSVRHPFLDDVTTRVLAGDMINSDLSNWIVADDGRYELIDQEWTADSGADIDLVAVRALLYLAHDIVVQGVAHPWASTATTRDLAATIGALCGLSLTDELIERWIVAESAFQSLVQDVDRSHMESVERQMLSTSRLDPIIRRSLPMVTLQRDLSALQATSSETSDQLELLQHELDGATAKVTVLEREVWGARDYAITIASELSELRRENLKLEHDHRAILHHVEGLEKVRDHQVEMYSSMTWRLGAALLWPLHWIRRLASAPTSRDDADGT